MAREAGLADVPALAAALRRTPDGPLVRLVVQAMTTNETSFFRDGQPFDTLRERVLPALLRRRKAERRLSIWCAASSTGQEPYSIALVLREHFPETADWQIDFLATDLSSDVLVRARAGRYLPAEVDRGLPPALLERWFSRQGDHWAINEEIRRLVRFQQLNLLDPWPIGGQVDLVFMRNVLIYFDIETKRTLLQRARRLLHPEGFLFLGSAESPMGLDDRLERLPITRAGCYRIGAAKA